MFENNSVVCFLGDSVMSGSLMEEYIFEYYLKKFPHSGIRVYDTAVGGGTAKFGLERLDEDLFTHNPTDVFVMYGPNDINGYEGTAEEREKHFFDDMSVLLDELKRRGVKIYLGNMFRVDEPVAKIEGWDFALSIRKTVRLLAEKYDCPVCDFYSLMTPLFEKASLLMEDRLHPNLLGQVVMAKLFLYNQGFEEFAPEKEGFFDDWYPAGDGDHRMIFVHKIRAMWLAIRSIATIGDTDEEKVRILTEKLATRNNNQWDEFSYYRAVDFIEFYPNRKFYREEMERTTDKMLNDAIYN